MIRYLGAPGARRNCLDENEKARVVEMWQAGKRAKAISEEVGCSESNVYMLTKKVLGRAKAVHDKKGWWPGKDFGATPIIKRNHPRSVLRRS